MSYSPNLEIDLLMAAQAQKHVTMNEALLRIDQLVQARLESIDLSSPPEAPQDGQGFYVADEATDQWQGQEGRLAYFSNGGWQFFPLKDGWQFYVIDRGAQVVWKSQGFAPLFGASDESGAATSPFVRSLEVASSAGATFATSSLIKANDLIYGVTARVITNLTATGASSWRLGVADSDNRYGSGLGLQKGAYAMGLTGTPVTYYADTPLLISAEGGTFDGVGKIRIAVHGLRLTPPSLV